MVWQIAAQAALQIYSSYQQARTTDKLQDAQSGLTKANVYSANTVNQANADAANLMRGASNEFSAAQTSLQNVLRTLGNQQKMYVYGQQYNAAEENAGRVMDSMVDGKLSAQLKGAATLGALRAQSAANGTGGSSTDIMRSIAALAQGAAETSAQDNQKYVQFDTLLRKQGLLRSAASSLDYGQTLPTMDYGINVAPLVQAPIPPSLGRDSPLGSAIKSWVAGGGVPTLLSGLGGSSSRASTANGNVVQSGGGGSLGDFFSGA
jgi:hypothetical protein